MCAGGGNVACQGVARAEWRGLRRARSTGTFVFLSSVSAPPTQSPHTPSHVDPGSRVGPFGVGFLSNRDAEEEGSGKRSNICLVCPSLYFLLHPQMCRCSSWVHIRKPTSSRREYAEALRGDGCASGDSNAPRIVCHAGGSRGANQRGAARCGDRRQGSSVGKYSETAAESTEGARG